MDTGRKAVLATITGRVQGVSFRVWTRLQARRLGLAGWVRNEDDGSVTALLVGPDETVAKMVTQLWKGPPGASVSNIMVRETTPGEELGDFKITV
jgi:acylphosphatase